MTAFAFPLTLKHLPGQHEQQAHAGLGAAVAARLEDLEPQDKVFRQDAPEIWERMGLRRPTDEELLETFGLQDQGVNIVVYYDRLGYLYLQGSLNAGEFAGTQIFQRSIAKSPSTGDVIVSHDSFNLPEPLQEQGLGVDLLERSEALYKKLGINKIILTANSTVGKYAWARMGFDFYGEKDRNTVVNEFYNYLHTFGVPNEEWPVSVNHPWEIAAYSPKTRRARFGDKRFISGKDFLIYQASSYDVAKRLSPKDEGFLVGQAYYKERQRKRHG